MRFLVAALAAVAMFGLLPPAAGALVVHTEDVYGGDMGTIVGVGVRATASPGERNDVLVEWQGDRVVITERAAPLVAGEGCVATGAGAASCSLPALREDGVTLSLGDGDDTALVSVPSPGAVIVLGGPGSDLLAGTAQLYGDEGDDTLAGASEADGGAGDDRVTGTPGADRLAGGGGADVLDGGAGDDTLVDETSPDPGPDRLDGGPGRDRLDYGLHQEPVVVDLAAAQQVAATADVVTGFEDVRLGGGDDVVRGTAGRNAIWTGAGHDVIRAGGGSDTVFAGPDADIVDTGRDYLTDVVHCGGGEDMLLHAETSDSILACDVVYLNDVDRPANRLERRGRRVRVLLRCARVTTDCRGVVVMRTRDGASLGRATFACAADPCASGWMRMGRRARRARVTVITALADGTGEAVQRLVLPR